MDLKLLKDIPPWEWPRGAAKTFLALLRDPHRDAGDRLLAAEFAGDLVVMNDALADALLSIVGSAAEPEDLRAQAAISLGPVLEQADEDEFDDPDAVPVSEKSFRKIKQSLRKVYLDSGVPKLLRRRILEAAVRAPEEWHTGAIRSAYAGDDQEWKLTAVFGMNYVRGFDKQILQSLESADPAIHYQAVRAAGTWEWTLPGRTSPRSPLQRIPARICGSPPSKLWPASVRSNPSGYSPDWPIPRTKTSRTRPPKP